MKFVWENVPSDVDVDVSKTFIAVYIREGSGEQITLGSNPFFRYHGFIQFSVFIPINTGTRIVKQIADALDTMFRNAQFSQGNSGLISCFTPVVEIPGKKPNLRHDLQGPVERGRMQVDITVPYRRDLQYPGVSISLLSPPVNGGSWHLPIEVPDGIITTFTFIGLPSNQNAYILVIGGLIQLPPFTQNGIQLIFSVPLLAGTDIAAYF